ncbi:hypothetical protein [Streptomyces sp. NPDC050428]|uniref:hypothetical protein n=1 Tax=Streptomyces sp. NPDC050428 TaxID=3155757 RepID=UPI003446AEE4
MDPFNPTNYAPAYRADVATRPALYYVTTDDTGVRNVQRADDSPTARAIQREQLREACTRSPELILREVPADNQGDARRLTERQLRQEHAPILPAETPTERPITVPDIAAAAVRLLGAPWTARPTDFQTAAAITRPPGGPVYRLRIDTENDLAISYKAGEGDGLPELDPNQLPTGIGISEEGVFVEDAMEENGLVDLAAHVANALLFVTGQPLI